MRFYFPIHLNGGNRGCEGIAKGSAIILAEPKENLIGLCTNTCLDKTLGIDRALTLIPYRKPSFFDKIVIFKILRRLVKDKVWQRIKYSYFYNPFLKLLEADDIMLSTGGDMLCYEDNQVIYTNNILHNKGIKTGLWGCSMGPENLTKEKEETLRNFSFLYVRESLTFAFFKEIGLKNVICLPDPAFVLEPEVVVMPPEFVHNEVIGVNLSNYVLGDFGLDKPFGMQVKALIDFILNNTNLHICLIPHVMWADQDDRIVASIIKNQYSDSERLSILDSEKYNYCQIRYIISHCRFFIGARTHAVISAYSTCVPTIALGYSIKSKGIAKDLGLPDPLVVNCKTEKANELLVSFHYLLDNEKSIKHQLNTVMPEYRQRPFLIKSVINQFIK